ncbi:MAG: DUF5318 family protein [Candidatus Nanopelagicales bacterium]
MAVPRGSQGRANSIRGSLVRGESGQPAKKRAAARTPEPITDPLAPRGAIDYALQRRADIRRFHRGGLLSSDFCDADPYLLKAARFHGEETQEDCPACHSPNLVHLTYVYGDELGPYSGRIRETKDLPSLATRFGDIGVYVVEICPDCQWNYLLRTYRIGDGVPRRALPTPADLRNLD